MPSFKELCRAEVAEGVGRRGSCADQGDLAASLTTAHMVPRPSGLPRPRPRRDKEAGIVVGALGEVGLDSAHGISGQQDEPWLAAFADDVDFVDTPVKHHLARQAGHFADPPAGRVESVDDSPRAEDLEPRQPAAGPSPWGKGIES